MSIIINYNDIMPHVFKVKIRKIGTSLGVLLPKQMLVEEKIVEGDEVEMALLNRRKELINKLVGVAKGAGPFKRDKTNRIDKY